MTQEQKHTPLPWFKWSCNQIKSEDGGWQRKSLAETYVDGTPEVYKVAEANAEFIVRACNSHYELLEAAYRLKGLINLDWQTSRSPAESCPFFAELQEVKALIAKAEGK